MSTTTTNRGLIKPELTDVADITAMNPNWDKIDEDLHNLAVELASAGVKVVNATSSNGVAYVGTADGITALTVGAAVMFVPNMTSTNTTPTFNLNNLGVKNIRRKLSIGTATTSAGSLNSWLYNNRPYLLVYDGTQWIVEDLTKPCASDLYGSVQVAQGGTGATDAANALKNLGVTHGTDDLTAGESELATGAVYLVYE